jgi:hypothetical protein
VTGHVACCTFPVATPGKFGFQVPPSMWYVFSEVILTLTNPPMCRNRPYVEGMTDTGPPFGRDVPRSGQFLERGRMVFVNTNHLTDVNRTRVLGEKAFRTHSRIPFHLHLRIPVHRNLHSRCHLQFLPDIHPKTSFSKY